MYTANLVQNGFVHIANTFHLHIVFSENTVGLTTIKTSEFILRTWVGRDIQEHEEHPPNDEKMPYFYGYPYPLYV